MYAKIAISRLLIEISGGHREAADSIIPLINDELRLTLVRQLAPDKKTNLIDVVELVNQVYVNMVKVDYRLDSTHRVIFLAFAAQSIRAILVNFAQNCLAEATCEAQPVIVLNAAETEVKLSLNDFLTFNHALDTLARQNSAEGKVAELWLFGGLGAGEIAELPEKSLEKVTSDLKEVKSWLGRVAKK